MAWYRARPPSSLQLLLRKLLVTQCHSPRLRQWSGVCGPAAPTGQSRELLRELVSTGQYQCALAHWEESKARGTLNTHTYTTVMAMCEQLGSSETALAVREDMKSQGLSMETKCCLHFVNTLVADERAEEAVECVRECSHYNTALLTRVARRLLDTNHPGLALEVCLLTSDPCTSLLCTQLESLGSLGRVEEMEQLLEASDVENELFQVAFVNGLSLCGHYNRAMEHLSTLQCVTGPRTLCLLLEAVRRAGDVRAAAQVLPTLWEQAFSLKESDLSSRFLEVSMTAAKEERCSHLCRAVNACIHLQALALRDETLSSQTDLGLFLTYDFHSFLYNQNVYSDQHTYSALLLKLCFDESALEKANAAIRSLFQCGSRLDSAAFVEWTKHCGPISPSQANRVLSLIRRNFRARYDVPLSLADYRRLLGVELVCGENPQELTQALGYIRTIKNTMSNQGLLSETSHWYPIVRALTTLSHVSGPLFINYDDMLARGVNPDLSLYKIVAHAAESNSTAAHSAAFDWWRLLNSRVVPDVELMNSLIRCCEVCGEGERGFMFLGLFEKCQLTPDLETFDALFKICESTVDSERLLALSSLGEKMLPQHRDTIVAIVQRIQTTWSDTEQNSPSTD